MSAITTDGLTKRYGDRVAVGALELDVPTGVVAGFIGPNGAGKTTTMAMLLGLVKPTSGAGTILGHPLTRPASYLSRVGALIEGPAFYPALTGRQNLAMVATVGGHERSQIPALLDLVGLAGRGDDRFGRYSLGMKQRLGVAAALVGRPELLILDEPANGLDPAGIREMRDLLGRLARSDRTVFVSSHVLAELEQICDWLVMIDEGRLVFQGPATDLLADSASGVAVDCEDSAQGVRLRRVLAGHGLHLDAPDGPIVVRLDAADPRRLAGTINRLAFESGIVVSELRTVRSNLEDRYLALVRGGDR